MKQETAVVVIKGLCYVLIGGLTPLASGMTQWANLDQWPDRINWITLIAGALVGAATQLLSFLSNAYGSYQAARKEAGDTALLLRHQQQALRHG